MNIVIKGIPVAQARPKFYRRGNYVGAYSSQETIAGRWLLLASQQIADKLTGPLDVTCKFYFPRPKSHFGTGRNSGKLKPSAPLTHCKKPDIDNLVKFAFDCLNGVAWGDDAQIIKMVAYKQYCAVTEDPRTEIEVNSCD
jgi:Holliday junction resolvase RusA-like endonuclease